MAVKKHGTSSTAEYTVSYSGMGGVAFDKADGGNKRYRFSYLENMYKDYSGSGGGMVESIPGFRQILSLGKRVHGIYNQKQEDGRAFMVIHAGDGLYRFAIDERDEIASPPKKLATLNDSKSSAFNSGCDLYVLDGKNITKLSADGTSDQTSPESTAPYVPTTFINGKEYEQRNLLTNRFKEKYLITSAKNNVTATDGLRFAVTSEEALTAAVTGIEANVLGYIHIPAYTTINGRDYKVTEIADDAFRANATIEAVNIPDTVERIGDRAFMSAQALERVVCGDSVSYIGELAFINCACLSSFYLGIGVEFIGMDCLSLCPALKVIDYGGDSASFQEISNRQDFSKFTVNYGSYASGIRVEIPIHSPTASLSAVWLEEELLTDYMLNSKDGFIRSIMIDRNYASQLDGKEIVIEGIASPTQFTRHSVGSDFIEENQGSISGYDAITGCTVCECFDGRIFLTGNPSLPNTVFYTSRDSTGRNNPLYFGSLNYFNDGVGSFEIGSLRAAGDSLAVFKKGDDGGGSIYYHTPRETGVDILPKIYPVTYVHSGIYAKGPSISFYDDPVFISGLGLTALDKKAINLERSIVTRSTNVNSKLLCEDLESILLAKWCGYLVVLAKERMYLADSRATFTGNSGSLEYEWFYATGIGSRTGGSTVYRFSESSVAGLPKPKEPHARVTTPVSTEIWSGLYRTLTSVDGVKYLVYDSGEREGGVLHPATAIGTYEDTLLFFGTENGDVMQFNNEMRGVAPPHVMAQDGFDASEYKKDYGRIIHPYYYTRDGYAQTYAISTVSDDGDIPHLTKSTVKGSLTVKLKCFGKSRITVEVGTEKQGYAEVAESYSPSFDFRDLDFSALSFDNSELSTIPIKERSKGWIEKSVAIYSNEYASPFGLESITYRFRVKGKIKY